MIQLPDDIVELHNRLKFANTANLKEYRDFRNSMVAMVDKMKEIGAGMFVLPTQMKEDASNLDKMHDRLVKYVEQDKKAIIESLNEKIRNFFVGKVMTQLYHGIVDVYSVTRVDSAKYDAGNDRILCVGMAAYCPTNGKFTLTTSMGTVVRFAEDSIVAMDEWDKFGMRIKEYVGVDIMELANRIAGNEPGEAKSNEGKDDV